MSTFILIFIISVFAFFILNWEWRQLPRRALSVRLFILKRKVQKVKESMNRLNYQLKETRKSFAKWEAR